MEKFITKISGLEEHKNPKVFQFFRFFVTGGSSALFNFIILYSLTEFLGIWYLLSTIISFSLASVYSFTLQKFWAFKDVDKQKTAWQLPAYILMAICNLFINSGIVYLLVEKFGVWYMLAQFIAAGLIAFESYAVFKFLIFKIKD